MSIAKGLLMGLCVCPVAGTSVVLTVPPVKQAIHKATAPRVAARPSHTARVASVKPTAPPCELPASVLMTPGPLIPAIPELETEPFDFGPSPLPQPWTRVRPGASLTSRPVPPDATPPVLVPEPLTWATTIAGFALIGGAMRRVRSVRV